MIESPPVTDWLDEIEEKKRREQQERESTRAEARRRSQASQAIHRANYEQYKDRVQAIFDELISISERANSLTDTKLNWKRSEESIVISDAHAALLERKDWYPYNHRYMEISFFDSTFSVLAEFPNREKTLYEPPTASKYFRIPIDAVSKAWLSSWVKWLATGQ
jgi:hypothetical protein